MLSASRIVAPSRVDAAIARESTRRSTSRSNELARASLLDAMFGASAFIERRVRRARFDQALIDDEHPTPGARATRRARNRRESRRRESRIIDDDKNLDD